MQWLELHDSKVAEVRSTSNGLQVSLRPAYLHRSPESTGRSGWTGWLQPMDVLLVGGELPKTLPELPARIWGGRCRVGERVLEDGMEVPFESHEQAVLELVLATGQLVVSGNGLRVAAAGGARYLEDLPEDMWSP